MPSPIGQAEKSDGKRGFADGNGDNGEEFGNIEYHDAKRQIRRSYIDNVSPDAVPGRCDGQGRIQEKECLEMQQGQRLVAFDTSKTRC